MPPNTGWQNIHKIVLSLLPPDLTQTVNNFKFEPPYFLRVQDFIKAMELMSDEGAVENHPLIQVTKQRFIRIFSVFTFFPESGDPDISGVRESYILHSAVVLGPSAVVLGSSNVLWL